MSGIMQYIPKEIFLLFADQLNLEGLVNWSRSSSFIYETLTDEINKRQHQLVSKFDEFIETKSSIVMYIDTEISVPKCLRGSNSKNKKFVFLKVLTKFPQNLSKGELLLLRYFYEVNKSEDEISVCNIFKEKYEFNSSVLLCLSTFYLEEIQNFIVVYIIRISCEFSIFRLYSPNTSVDSIYKNIIQELHLDDLSYEFFLTTNDNYSILLEIRLTDLKEKLDNFLDLFRLEYQDDTLLFGEYETRFLRMVLLAQEHLIDYYYSK